ncbi:MAG TPA: hypothetical protein H9774_11865 [Candidatus Desulfovibrio gallistercoris]|nr:hypothetical protein [Candidatus Desulfovibrio gallistercoris]
MSIAANNAAARRPRSEVGHGRRAFAATGKDRTAEDTGNGVPQNQNSASLTQEQREADKRLLDIIDKRLDAMSAVQTRANAYMVALCLLVIIQTATLIGFGVWTGFTT